MRILRHPVAQFVLLSLLIITLISVGTNQLVQQAAEDEALAEAQVLNAVRARSVVDPGITRGLVDGRGFARDKFHRRQVRNRLMTGNVRRVNLWSESGKIIYSNAPELIGSEFELSEGQRRVLAEGGTGSEIADPDDPENAAAADSPGAAGGDGELVRIYTRLSRVPGDEALLFEAYYDLEDIEDRRGEIYASFRWITIGGPVLLIVLVTPILFVLTRRLTSGANERERLLHSALDASDAERRRIARDLHDTVVQDLAGTAYSISAVARDTELPETVRERLGEAGASLRVGLKSLRSLLAEIHPPDLHAEGLAAALADLIAPAAASEVQASVSVEGAETASDERAALVWRVAQEAVRNALRHADASTLAVTVRGDGTRLLLEVVDDGTGFDPKVKQSTDSFGLRGLRSLVSEAGGTLDVRSSPGEGTTVVMEVAAR